MFLVGRLERPGISHINVQELREDRGREGGYTPDAQNRKKVKNAICLDVVDGGADLVDGGWGVGRLWATRGRPLSMEAARWFRHTT